MSEASKPTRGRPKTLDRDHVLRTAMMQYWSKGPVDVSINEICTLTGASKPGVYREFGSDDGLKKSVLDAYHSLAIQPLIDVLEQDLSTQDTIDGLIGFMTQDRTALGIPQGCLFVMMRAQSQHFGAATQAALTALRGDLFDAYAAWIARSKLRGDFADIPNDIATHFIDAQHGGAMRMQREGVPNQTIQAVLRTALGLLAPKGGPTPTAA